MQHRHQPAGERAGKRQRSAAPGVLAALALLLCVALAAAPAQAQQPGSGFLFREPTVGVKLRGGFALAGAGSDIFSLTRRELTLGRGDFNGPSLALDLAFRLAPRVDIVLGTAYAGTSARAEYRDWVDQDDLPIEQTMSFHRVPLTASIKAYLTPRGRSVGRFAWIPARWAPYMGAGVGAEWYSFRRRGDFVDYESLDVVSDDLKASGWTPVAHAMAGVDYALSPRFALTGEGRYSFAKGNLGDAFDGFSRIDLSGFSTTIGIQFRF